MEMLDDSNDCTNVPDRTGWTPLRMMETARKGESSATASATVVPSVNMQLMTWRHTSTKIAITTETTKELEVTTTTTNWAALGWPAPSSLLTLTLKNDSKIDTYYSTPHIFFVPYIYIYIMESINLTYLPCSSIESQRDHEHPSRYCHAAGHGMISSSD